MNSVESYVHLNKEKKRDDNRRSNRKGLIVFCLLVIGLILMVVAISIATANSEGTGNEINFRHNYIGKLHVEGEISSDGEAGLFVANEGYFHDDTLNSIEDMMNDDNNKGIFLMINSPGGSVSASDELYLKLQEYKDKTKRPVYAYFQDMAASGGYYVSAGADKIYANRNCWTGSIGVTIGNIYDASELLSNLGIKANPITSGPNKAMGDPSAGLSDEQKQIYQGLVDEAYEQFVGIVADGRGMTREEVIPLADGRIYTAKQAKANGLIDEIMAEEDAEQAVLANFKDGKVKIEDIVFTKPKSLIDNLLSYHRKDEIGVSSTITNLMKEQGKFHISYMAPISK